MARPRKRIDAKQVEALAAIDCSYEEMAAVLGCHTSTLWRRYANVIESARAEGRSSLKRTQFRVAMGQDAVYDADGNCVQEARLPNPTMLIWLGKIRLGQRETIRTEHTGADGGPIVTTTDLVALRAKIAQRLGDVGQRLTGAAPLPDIASSGNGNGTNGNHGNR